MAHDHADLHQPHHHHLYRLSSLQIGDIQSYVSSLFLHITCEGTKLVFLVDNGPWTTKKQRSKPAELWQLMVTKSRASPFANWRLPPPQDSYDQKLDKAQECLATTPEDSKYFRRKTRWNILQMEQGLLHNRLKSLVRVKELSYLLYGCIAFELGWVNVRGINYLNELQTDTCVALEAKLMTKRDFDSLQQALTFYNCRHDGIEDEVLITGRGRKDELNPEVRFQGVKAADRTGLSPSGSVSAKRGRCTACAKLKRDSHGGPLHEGCPDCRICSSLDLDVLGHFHVKKRHVCDTGQCSSPGGVSSRESNEASQEAESLVASERAVQDGDCQSTEAMAKCLWHTTGMAHLSKSCECNLINRNESFESGKQPTSSEIEEPFLKTRRRKYIHAVEALGETDDDRMLESPSSAGNLYTDKSPAFRRKEPNVNDMVLESSWNQLGSVSYVYKDILVLFRFNDPILPLELKRTITANQRLLKMLESGLPSWVVFLQSYPIFCNIYRPWMRPFAKTMYFLISLITVIIGFYDLYKNVPVLKATAARICGPLFEWIEAWEMVSRLKYLGTMLFLQNCEKAIKWLLMVLKTMRQMWSMMMQPMIEPFEEFRELLWPVWSAFSEGLLKTGTLLWMNFSSLFMYMSSLLQFIIWPFVLLVTSMWRLATILLYPLISVLWTVLLFPLCFLREVANLMTVLFSSLSKVILNLWQILSETTQLFYASWSPTATSMKAIRSSSPVSSTWRTLWNDIFSKVFRAVRSIVNGFVAFFVVCNRHRLSIYNHVVAFLLRLTHLLKSAHAMVSGAYRQMFEPPLPTEEDSQDEVNCHCCHQRKTYGSTMWSALSDAEIDADFIPANDEVVSPLHTPRDSGQNRAENVLPTSTQSLVSHREKKLLKWAIEDSQLVNWPETSQQGVQRSLRSKKNRRYVNFALMHVILDSKEPSTFEEASDLVEWRKAMEEEYDPSMKNGSWKLVQLPKGKKLIGTKWVYKLKCNYDSSLDKYKVSLVAKGYVKKEGID